MARRRRSVLYFPPRHPLPIPPSRVRARSHFGADNRAVSLPSRRVLDPSLFATSFGVCPRCSFLSPFSFSRPRRLSSSLSPFTPSRSPSLFVALHTALRRVFGTFLLFLHRLPSSTSFSSSSTTLSRLSSSSFSPPLPPSASAAVSMPRSDDGRSQTHPGARGDRRHRGRTKRSE